MMDPRQRSERLSKLRQARESRAGGAPGAANAGRLRRRLAGHGISTAPSTTQIVPVVIGYNARTMALCERLLARGFYAQGIRHPSVPAETARLRLTPMATHRPEEIDALADAIAAELAAPA